MPCFTQVLFVTSKNFVTIIVTVQYLLNGYQLFYFYFEFLRYPITCNSDGCSTFLLTFYNTFCSNSRYFLVAGLVCYFSGWCCGCFDFYCFAFLDCCRRFCKLQRRFLNLDYYFLSVISNLYSNGCLSRFFRFYNAFGGNSRYFLVAGCKFNFSSYIIFYNRNGCRGFSFGVNCGSFCSCCNSFGRCCSRCRSCSWLCRCYSWLCRGRCCGRLCRGWCCSRLCRRCSWRRSFYKHVKSFS